jgi:hypothetical protein
MKVLGKKLATTGIALVSVGAIAVAPTVQAPPRPVPAVQLAAATSPTAVQTSPTVLQPPAQQSNYLGALFSLDLGRFIIPPSAGQPPPTPPQIPGPSPTPTNFEFEDAIINTYHAIEPWVRWGFEVATYAVGWIPWVGWLSPQIMIFYNFGERIVESLVVNSANWLWGPLPFLEGLGNVAVDSWNALVQLGIDQWNFWLPPLPPLPPLPLAAQQAQTQLATGQTLAPVDQQVAPPTARPHPLRDAFAALRRLLAGPDPVAPQNVDPQGNVDQQGNVGQQEKVGLQEKLGLRLATPANPRNDGQVQADLPRTDATPRNPEETKTNPLAGTPNLSGTKSDITSPPRMPLGKPKPFAKKPKPTAETSNQSTRPSNQSVGASNSPVGTSNENVGTPHPPKPRFNGANKHRLTGSPSGSTASSPGTA